MVCDISQQFFFEAAHTLHRDYDAAPSQRLHGHTYHAEITVRGEPDSRTGMVVDLAVLRAHIETIKAMLDHQHLNDVDGLEIPTLENLTAFIAHHARRFDARVNRVRVWRSASGDSCSLRVGEP